MPNHNQEKDAQNGFQVFSPSVAQPLPQSSTTGQEEATQFPLFQEG